MNNYYLFVIMFILGTACSLKNPEERFQLKLPSELVKRDWRQVQLREDQLFLQSVYKDKEMTLLLNRYEVESGAEKDGLFQAKIHQLKALFATQFTPYGGVITQKTSCLKNLDSEKVFADLKMDSISFFLDADERLNYGQCLEKPFFKSHYQILKCKTNSYLYEIKLFYPASDKKVTENDLKALCL